MTWLVSEEKVRDIDSVVKALGLKAWIKPGTDEVRYYLDRGKMEGIALDSQLDNYWLDGEWRTECGNTRWYYDNVHKTYMDVDGVIHTNWLGKNRGANFAQGCAQALNLKFCA